MTISGLSDSLYLREICRAVTDALYTNNTSHELSPPVLRLASHVFFRNLRQRSDRPRRSKRNYNTSAASTISITDASMYSAVESDLDDEFCDLSNSEEDTKLTLR